MGASSASGQRSGGLAAVAMLGGQVGAGMIQGVVRFIQVNNEFFFQSKLVKKMLFNCVIEKPIGHLRYS